MSRLKALFAGFFFLFFITMTKNSNNTAGTSLVNDMLQKTSNELKEHLLEAIKRQVTAYENAQQETFRKLLGNSDSYFDLTQHFKYQCTIGDTLREMQNSYLKYFGLPWDFLEEPKEVEEPKAKRGRPKKNAI